MSRDGPFYKNRDELQSLVGLEVSNSKHGKGKVCNVSIKNEGAITSSRGSHRATRRNSTSTCLMAGVTYFWMKPSR